MASKTFIEIHRIVIRKGLNTHGFRAIDIINNTNCLTHNTIKTFLPKHARIRTIYFERIGNRGSGLYKIKDEFI
jgi:hypothetical protein